MSAMLPYKKQPGGFSGLFLQAIKQVRPKDYCAVGSLLLRRLLRRRGGRC